MHERKLSKSRFRQIAMSVGLGLDKASIRADSQTWFFELKQSTCYGSMNSKLHLVYLELVEKVAVLSFGCFSTFHKTLQDFS